LKSYTKEIERLNEEIKNLKNINNALNKSKKFPMNEKPVLQEIMEEKVKLLSKYIQENKINISNFESEFYLRDLGKTGEIDYESFYKVLLN
jgi:spore germination protein GerM